MEALKASSVIGTWTLLLFACLSSGVASVELCTQMCSCSKAPVVVRCQNLYNISWAQFVGHLPDDVMHVVIEESSLDWVGGKIVGNRAVTLPTVQTLSINHARMSSLHKSLLAPFINLRELHLNNNSLQNMHLDVTFECQLEVLVIENNEIPTLTENAFRFVPLVQELRLDYNHISRLDEGIFKGLPYLEHLDLSHNQIHYIHPHTFSNMSSLRVLSLEGNNLQYLHPKTFSELDGLSALHLADNPWDCSCGLKWLVDSLQQESMEPSQLYDFGDRDQVTCSTPPHIQHVPLHDLEQAALLCYEPAIVSKPLNRTIYVANSISVPCNATGYPSPSVYWITPRGVLVHPDKKHWLATKLLRHSTASLYYSGKPTYTTSRVYIGDQGDLVIQNFRNFFHGEYTCVAVSPAGQSSSTLIITIASHLKRQMDWSVLCGFVFAGAFMLVGIGICSMRMCLIKCCCRKPPRKPNMTIFVEVPVENYSPSISRRFTPSRSPYLSPSYSPVKCITPSEFNNDDGDIDFQRQANVKAMLVDVRWRLRKNMEKEKEKMRNRAENVRCVSRKYAQNIRHSSSQAMQNLRETSSHAMRNIRTSSSHYVRNVRAGMSVGVEQVKYSVMSLKELCGTGDLMHTISTISMSTDVDSQERKSVVKTITYV